MQDLWVFGYGSLMWRPGFDHVERQHALLHGYHRGFCVYSHVHRGTPSRPGLVFGLDAGGSCRGIAFRVQAHLAREVRQYLVEREQVTSVYAEAVKPVKLVGSGTRVEALCFLVDRAHHQYAGRLPFETQVDMIAGAAGQSGDNPDYLQSTVEHLHTEGIPDAGLDRLWAAVSARQRGS